MPVAIRRRFSKLAALLEVADDEFFRLRREIDDYKADLYQRLVALDDGYDEIRRIEINETTLMLAINHNPDCVECERQLFALPKVGLDPGEPPLSRLVNWLHDLDIRTIGQFVLAYLAFKEQIVLLAREVLSGRPEIFITRAGWSLHLLAQILSGRLEDIEATRHQFMKWTNPTIGPSFDRRVAVVRYLASNGPNPDGDDESQSHLQ